MLIRQFANGTVVEYDRGRFDEWCVYVTRPGVARRPPLDVEYFGELLQMANTYGNERVHNEFIEIYNATSDKVEATVLERIHELASHYKDIEFETELLYTVVYAAMVSEERQRVENPRRAPNGKRLKRLGIHQIFFEGFAPQDAANWSRGRRAAELADECRQRGF